MFDYIDPILQLTTGSFFAAAGYRKVFDPITRGSVWDLFAKYQVPTWQGWMVTIGQLLGGLGFLFGVLSWWAALGLMPIMIGAFKLSTFPEIVAAQPRGFLGWVIKLSCNREALLIAILVSLLVRGF